MRSKNSFFNILGSMGYYLFAIIFNLLNQAILVRIMGIEYSGINGLFTNVLNLLSVVELGIGNVIIFKLYEPVAKNDKEEIKSWLNFYKKCYNVITIIILVIGCLIAPFISSIIGNPESIPENIYVLYFISLSSVVSSYIVSYKRSILNASQKNYIVSIINMVNLVVLNILQMLVLFMFRNYIVYLILKTICVLFSNLYLNHYVNKKYSYINEKCKKISKKEIVDVVQRIKAIFFEKVSYVVNKGIDNILITKYFGVAYAGLYTNYHLIASTLVNVLFKSFVSIIPSVGNLLVEKSKEKNFDIFKKMFLINSFLVGLFSICFITTINNFINVWVGKQYLLSNSIVFSFAIYMIVDGIRYSIMTFRDGAGICVEDKNTYIVAVLINLVTSIVFCRIYGMIGVIVGTSLGYLYLDLYSYPKYTFKTLFNNSVKEYFKIYFKFILQVILGTVLSVSLCILINFSSDIINFLIHGMISTIIWTTIFCSFNVNTKEFEYFSNIIKNKIKKRGTI